MNIKDGEKTGIGTSCKKKTEKVHHLQGCQLCSHKDWIKLYLSYKHTHV